MTPPNSMDETVQRPMGGAADERPPPAQLRVVYPLGLRATVSLATGAITLGRRPGEDGHKLDDPTASRRHLAVRWDRELGQHVVEELGSRNGSRIEGRDLRAGDDPEPLEDGDVLRAGDVLMIYECSAAVEAVDAHEVSTEAIPGDAATTVQLRATLGSAARDPSPILLIGETGTGKEYIAREIHRLSGRVGPMVAVNCAALSPQLIESQLFGHAKGAFTGAQAAHDGLFRAADGGTIFLDEIGELPRELQPKLLRVLQEHEVHPVGETRPIKVDVRIVSATLRDLTEMIDDGGFRLDLYARLSPWEIRVPALRERRADLLAWLERMHREWHDKRDRSDVGPLTHEADAVERLLLHDWPDNLRGIDRLIHRAMSEPGGTLDVRHPSSAASVDSGQSTRSSDGDTDDRLERVARTKRRAKPTKDELTRALDENGGSVRATAKHYGRDRRQIYRWMEQFGLRDKGEG